MSYENMKFSIRWALPHGLFWKILKKQLPILFEFSIEKINCGFKVHVSSIVHENKLTLLEVFDLKTYHLPLLPKNAFYLCLSYLCKETQSVFQWRRCTSYNTCTKTMNCHHGVDRQVVAKQKRKDLKT